MLSVDAVEGTQKEAATMFWIILEKFLRFLREEDFEQGRNWAVTELNGRYRGLHQLTLQLEKEPLATPTHDLAEFPVAAYFYAFAALYNSARMTIETSYNYSDAAALISSGASFLKRINRPLSCSCY